MKGHIFNLLEKFIIEITDANVYESIIAECRLITKGPFIRPGKYPDEDLAEIVDKTVQYLGITVNEAHYAFGKWIFPHLLLISAPEVRELRNPKALFLQLDYIHRIELKKLWPDAEPPTFQCEDTGPAQLRMIYDSRREMFDLVDGVIASVADYYKYDISFTKSYIDQQNYRICQYDLVFQPA
jgi:hypothetical protein